MSSEKLIAILAARITEQLLQKLQEMANAEPKIPARLLTIRQASAYLGRSETALQHLISRRALPVVRVGRRVHLDRHELDSFIEKHRE